MRRFRGLQSTLAMALLMVLPMDAFHSARADAARDFSKPLTGDQKIQQALNRLTFGARPGDFERVRAIGLNKWIEQQLNPQSIDDSAVERKLSTLQTLKMTPQQLTLAEINDTAGFLKVLNGKKPQKKAAAPIANGQTIAAPAANSQPKPLTRQQQQTLQMLQDADMEKQTSIQAIGELQTDKIARAIDSNRQLYEILVDFWSNHFNIDVKKKGARTLKVVDERDVIRPHVLGKFRDLLGASAKSPAMLVYLDNASSTREFDPQQRFAGRFNGRFNQRRAARLGVTATDQNIAAQNAETNAAQPIAAPKKRGGLNENYGREIMELHTLGVDGGYTQQDVTEVARCFTGWGYDRNTGEFVFRARAHDDGEKVVLGHKIPAGGGERDGEMVLDILASHPSTAKHLARELCVRLVADEPPQSIVDKATKTFLQTDGDLRAVVETIITSPEFFSQGAYRAKIKSPFEYCVSAVRALGGTMLVPDPNQQLDRLRLIGDGASSVRGNSRFKMAGQKSLALHIADMGQPLYSYQAPTGYSEDSRAWVSTGALVSRLNYALDLTAGNVYNVIATPTQLLKGVDEHDRNAIMNRFYEQILGGDVSPTTRSTLEREAGQDAFVDRAKLAALILGSPEFQRH